MYESRSIYEFPTGVTTIDESISRVGPSFRVFFSCLNSNYESNKGFVTIEQKRKRRRSCRRNGPSERGSNFVSLRCHQEHLSWGRDTLLCRGRAYDTTTQSSRRTCRQYRSSREQKRLEKAGVKQVFITDFKVGHPLRGRDDYTNNPRTSAGQPVYSYLSLERAYDSRGCLPTQSVQISVAHEQGRIWGNSDMVGSTHVLSSRFVILTTLRTYGVCIRRLSFLPVILLFPYSSKPHNRSFDQSLHKKR